MGAVLGQGSPIGWPGQEAAQVEDAQTVEGTGGGVVGRWVPPGLLGFAVADLLDADPAQRGDRRRLRVCRPLVDGAGHGAAGVRRSQRLFEGESVPGRHALGHHFRRTVDRAVEYVADALRHVRELALEMDKTAVPTAVELDQRPIQGEGCHGRRAVLELLEGKTDQ